METLQKFKFEILVRLRQSSSTACRPHGRRHRQLESRIFLVAARPELERLRISRQKGLLNLACSGKIYTHRR